MTSRITAATVIGIKFDVRHDAIDTVQPYLP